MSDAHSKSPGPTKNHCRTMPTIVLAPQYRPRPAGTASTNQAKIAGIIHCIIWFICACCDEDDDAFRAVEIRCCSHIEQNTTTVRKMFPLAERSRNRNSVLSGTAF